MYGFLILLPLTLICFLIGALVATSSQVADYVAYITDLTTHDVLTLDVPIWKTQYFWIQVAAHVAGFLILCFALVATVRTISAPLPADRRPLLRYFQIFLEVVFVTVPSAVLIWVSARALQTNLFNWIHWTTIAVLAVAILITAVITATRRPIELYGSTLRPFSLSKVDAFAVLSALIIGATMAVFAYDPIRSAFTVGMFPVLMLGTAAVFFLLAAIFSRRTSPVAVISSLITGVLVLHLIDQVALPPREFRYKKVPYSAPAQQATVTDVKAQRKVPNLKTAVRQWLDHRRPAIEAYRKKGTAYPLFFVAAQGGGMYAAYHPALSLARLADFCPEFSHHVFGISSVSGGSLGAAVYAELVRTLPARAPYDPASPNVGCSPTQSPTVDNQLQTRVHNFFKTDFLSPVIASAVIFDVPSMFIPPLRFQQDRARALESGFEAAWRNLGLAQPANDSLASDFLERWQPNNLAPALFMATTGVNFGVPVLVSQIDWAFNPSQAVAARPSTSATRSAAPSPALVQSVRDRLAQPEELPVGVANLLDFRPDIQLATSTAVVLSARFPFITPPGAIVENANIVRSRGFYVKTKVLEMTDGAFYDNSGAVVASNIVREIARLIENDSDFRDYKGAVRVHQIRFTDTQGKRQSAASESGHFELITPLVAYDSVRQARGVFLASVPPGTTASYIYLLDEWYEGSLNWLLSDSTRIGVEKRSSWLKGYENEVCCEVRDPVSRIIRRIPLTEDQERQLGNSELRVTRFVPNATQFNRILDLINRGIPVSLAPAPGTGPATPPPAAGTSSVPAPAPSSTPALPAVPYPPPVPQDVPKQ